MRKSPKPHSTFYFYQSKSIGMSFEAWKNSARLSSNKKGQKNIQNRKQIAEA
jgi:hypothetical protein